MYKFAYSILFLLFFNYSFSQDWNSARITVIYGGNIPFNFNSMRKYSTGIDIEKGTIIGITLKDLNEPGHDLEGFDLNIRTFNGQATISGDVYDIDLNKIRVKAENEIGLEAGFSTGYQDLSSGWTTIFSYTDSPWSSDLDWANHQLKITYECGKPLSDGGNGSMLGENPDYYTVEIEFELVPTGPGF